MLTLSPKVENCSRNHEVVPTSIIEKTARLHGGPSATRKAISALAKEGLIARAKEAKYDGYRLTYGGMDYLALHTLSRKEIYSVGSRIGVGKESDITMVADSAGVQKVLKIHRLGRISFRTVKTNRDYLKKKGGTAGRQQSGGWMYLSRLSAMKEFAFMQALREEGFPVPEPIAQSRHAVLMSFVDSFPLRQIARVPDPASLYAELISLILRLAQHGLIHGDFNEFNILIKEEPVEEEEEQQEETDDTAASDAVNLIPILIDFPQMVSMEHENAEAYFDRDVNCVKRFFERKFHFVNTKPGPFYKDAKKLMGKDGAKRLDASVEASGFTKKMLKDLEAAIRDQANSPGDGDREDYESSESGEDDMESGDEDQDAAEEEVDSQNSHSVNDGAEGGAHHTSQALQNLAITST